MMKRILALTLTLMVLSSTLFALPAFASSTSKVNLLTDIGVLEEQPTSKIFVSSYTRSDFAKALSMLDSVPAQELDDTVDVSQYASDIAKNENLAAICEVIQYNIMTTENDLFHPAAAVTQSEAAQALVKILGYEPVAVENGNTTAAYNALASKLGLFKGVSISNGAQLSYDEIGKILYNAMRVPFYVGDPVVHPTDRCFFDGWSLTEYSGTVLANSNLGLGIERVPHGRVNIGGTVYDTAIMIEDTLVGSIVTYYTRLIDGEEVVVSVNANNDSEMVTIDACDIVGVTETSAGFEIVYDDEEEIVVPQSAFMLVNNKTVSPSQALFDAFKSGSVTFLDTDGDGKYDVGHMTLLVWGIIEGVNSYGDALVVRIGSEFKKVNLDNADVVEAYIGKKVAEVTDLYAGMVVGIGCDSYSLQAGEVSFDFDNAETVKLFGSNRVETGYVEMISGDEVYVNEMDFRLSEAYHKLVSAGYMANLEAGSGVMLYFDRFGEIVYFKPDPNASGMEYGYLIDAAAESRGLNRELLLKIMSADGSINVYSTKNGAFVLDSLKTDVQTGSTVYTVDGHSIDLTQRQLVRFQATENIIRKLDTSVVRSGYESKSGSLSQSNEFNFYAEDQSTSKISRLAIDRRFAAADDCIVFVDEEYKDAVSPNEKRFSARNSSVLVSGRLHLAMFDADEMNEIPCFVYYTRYGQTDSGGEGTRQSLNHNEYYTYVVDTVYQTVDASGEPGWKLKVVGNDAARTVSAPGDVMLYEATDASWTGSDTLTLYERNPEELSTVLASGDLIRFTTSLDGTVNYIEKLFDFSDKGNTVYGVTQSGGTQHGFVNIEKCTDTAIMYTEDPTDTLMTNSDLTTYIFKKRTDNYKQVPVYNVSRGTASLYNYSDLPAIAKGDKVKAFVRYYDYTWIFDYIFYLYE